MLRFKLPKDDSSFRWTNHIKNKMLFYGLGEGRIRRVIKSPKRVDEGIAPGTVAAMQRNDSGKRKEEIWVMYQIRNQKSDVRDQNCNSKIANPKPYTLISKPSPILMISAWRYPGISRPGAQIPIPDDISAELVALDKIRKIE